MATGGGDDGEKPGEEGGVAEVHGGERKQKKDCLQEIQKAGFRPTLSSFFSPFRA